jgi:hypothetical protein
MEGQGCSLRLAALLVWGGEGREAGLTGTWDFCFGCVMFEVQGVPAVIAIMGMLHHA